MKGAVGEHDKIAHCWENKSEGAEYQTNWYILIAQTGRCL